MVSVCMYFQVHQPYRLRRYQFFDIGRNSNYFDEEKNMRILNKIAEKCYIPANKAILSTIKKHGNFKASYSITGTA